MGKVSRRFFLRGAGAAIALPYLPSLMGEAFAAGVTDRRLVLMFTPCGTVNRAAAGGVLDVWTPKSAAGAAATETDWVPPAGGILEPLNAVKSDVLVLDNVDLECARPWGGNGDIPCAPGGNGGYGPGDGHQPGIGGVWTGQPLANADPTATSCRNQAGRPLGPSLDQVLAGRIAAGTLGTKTTYSHLALAVRNVDGSSHGRSVFSQTGTLINPVAPENNPQAVFDRLFANIVTGPNPDEVLAAKRRAQGKKVLDAVLENLRSVNQRLSANDKARLDQHVTAINELETQLAAVPPPPMNSCMKPSLGTLPTGTWYLNDDQLPKAGKLQMDLLAMALACGLTRIATLQWTEAQSVITCTFLNGAGKPVQGQHHAMSHDYANNWPAIAEINRFYASQFAYLVSTLKGMADGAGGTMLDNTVLVWGNELGQGFDHNVTRCPFVLAGRGGIRPGRYLNCRSGATNARSNALLVSLAQLMGATDITSFGLASLNRGALGGLT